MPLDPQASAFLELITAQPIVPPEQRTVAAARAALRLLFAPEGQAAPAVGAVRDLVIPGGAGQPMAARLYQADFADSRPMLLYLHGGGWIAGDLHAYDSLCRELALASHCIVVAVEYRLAPEHKFPAAPLDCLAALRWVAAHAGDLGGDPRRLAIGGDSAGGNLAAAVTQLARDAGDPALAFQLLVYPVTNHAFDTSSYREFAEGYLLTRAGMEWHWELYLPSAADGESPLASPLRAASLAGLPPALVITPEYDPLRDEGEAYAQRLREAGVEVDLRRYAGSLHAFFSLGRYFDQGRRAVAEAGAALQRALSR